MAKKRRAPLAVVSSDDLVVEDGGEQYYPHAGESVTFKKRISPRDLMVIARASDLQDTVDKTGAAKLARFFHDEACVVLGRAILSWTWTDPYTEEVYPEPSADTLRDLDAQSELQYLLEKWLTVSNPPDEEIQEGNQQ
jgi:hypothetical protein